MLCIIGLLSFVEYEVCVAAETIAGIGPFSAPILFKTEETCKFIWYIIYNFSVFSS